MHIGLYGGTFDPIHLGHLRAAREVLESFQMDQLLWIPAASPPHKQAIPFTPAALRAEMIRLAIADCPDFDVSDIELGRDGLSYTIDTLIQLEQQGLSSRQISLVLGADAFLDIHSWKSFQALFERATLIILPRPGYLPSNAGQQPEYLLQYLRRYISIDYQWDRGGRCCRHPRLFPVHLAATTLLAISSTQIRNLVHAGRSIQFLTPERVVQYIAAKGLYT